VAHIRPLLANVGNETRRLSAFVFAPTPLRQYAPPHQPLSLSCAPEPSQNPVCDNCAVIRSENMSTSNRRLRAAVVFLCFSAFGAQFSHAASSKNPATWWPDPSSGLMWAGESSKNVMTWSEANDYCTSLHLGGDSGWRLPTLDEMKTISDYRRDSEHYYLEWKGGISAFSAWTSTLSGDQKAWLVRTGKVIEIPSFERFLVNGPDINHVVGKRSLHWAGALCTRPMEADLLQIAKDAQVNNPVPDISTLQAYVPLNKARLAYRAGQFQESITQSKSAIMLKPDLASAYWGAGISHGMLGQWDLAITNLEAALKLDKTYADAKDALKWAKTGQKAAKNGKSPKAQSPQWN